MRAQTYGDFEIVVADNASQEDYKAYLDSLGDRRIVYFRQPKAVPVTENWRKALALSSGDYVLMLGDDDALAPQFSDIVEPHIASDGPDVLYLGAYHYCYPGVIPDAPAGYFAAVKSEFLDEDSGEFCLSPAYAKELAASVLTFRHRFNYNAQHFLLKRSLIESAEALGGVYQSPYPDFFAAVLTFYRARTVLVQPKQTVIVGISPKSFGAYYFSLRRKEGYKFLDNQHLDENIRKFVDENAWPGDTNNTNWLIAAEMARRALAPSALPAVDIERYQAIQVQSLLRDASLHGGQSQEALSEISDRLPFAAKFLLDFSRQALRLSARNNRALAAAMLQAGDRFLGQYREDSYSLIDIGAHSSIGDALQWLSRRTSSDISRAVQRSASPTATKRVLRIAARGLREAFPTQAEGLISVIKRGPREVIRRAARHALSSVRALAKGRTSIPRPVLSILVRRNDEQCYLTPGLFDDFDFRNGDQLTVVPRSAAAKLHRTPDGDVHVLSSKGLGIRIPKMMKFYRFKGYDIPVHLANLTGAGPETFEELGKAHIANYRKYVGLEKGMTFLEIGSGLGRDAFELIDVLGASGRYWGIDVQRESIVWCQKNITRDHPNFRFYHSNAYHELHNPLGSGETTDFPLPAPDRSIDRVSLQSVLTHIFEEEVVHYLREIRRVLKQDGLAYVTFLLYSDEIVAASRKNRLTKYGLRFEHRYTDGCYVDNIQYPTGGVAYTDEAMSRMIGRAGLRLVRPYLKGRWSGYHAQPDDDGQDVAILALADSGH